MASKLRLLGIAPYESMRSLMLEVAQEYEEIELTVFVGDLQQGVEMARLNFYNDYDAIISRGGTAVLLRERLELPVIEIPILPQDIIRAMSLAQNMPQPYTIVGFPNVTANAAILCQLIQYQLDICTIQNESEVEQVLLSTLAKGTRTILCDKITHTTAIRLGLDVVLITSGAEGIHSAFSEALRLYHNYKNLREENRFLRSLIWNQVNHTVVLDDRGDLFFSTLTDNSNPILPFLRDECLQSTTEPKRRIIKQINGVLYSIAKSDEMLGGRKYTTYYFSSSKAPSADIQRGIRYVGRPEVERQYQDSLYGLVGLLRDSQDRITLLNKSTQPIIVYGENGTCKEQAVNYIYLQSTLQDKPLVIIDCFMLNSKAWTYLMDHHNSPLTRSELTIFIKNVDALTGEQRHQLLASMLATEICKRNRMIFSCTCPPGEFSTDAGRELTERLFCLPLYLQPLRQYAAQLPAAANMYLSHLNSTAAKQTIGIEPTAMQLLQKFSWPQNHNQFQRIFRELFSMSKGPYITVSDTQAVLQREQASITVQAKMENTREPLNLNRTLDEIEREIVYRVLQEEGGNQSRAAKRLDISRTTLWRMLNH